jgi:hypothetical protein
MKRPTIGLLGGATASAQAQWTAAFVQRLRELGWVEGIEYRWAEGRFERSPAIIAEFVRLEVDVIVTHATPNVVAAKQVTSVIPIVFPSAGDPVGQWAGRQLGAPGRQCDRACRSSHPPNSSTKSYAGQSRPISRSSSRGRLNWSLTSRLPRRWASPCRADCSRAPTN